MPRFSISSLVKAQLLARPSNSMVTWKWTRSRFQSQGHTIWIIIPGVQRVEKSEIFVMIEIFMWQLRIPKVRWSAFHSRRRNVGLCSRFAPWFKDMVNEWHFTKLFIIIFIITITIVSIITIIIVRSLTSWMLSTSSSSSSGESLLPEIPPVAASFRTIRSIDLPS